MNNVSPLTIFGATFLFWIAARGRFPVYAALVNKSAADNPTSESKASAAASGPLGATAEVIHDTVGAVWSSLKKT